MLIGYTAFDPIVVVLGTAWSIHLLIKEPTRLVAFLPAALSLYFFIPTVTYLTLWQTVPIVLIGWMLSRGIILLPRSGRKIYLVIAIAFFISALHAILVGNDINRAVIRIIYYMGLFSLFCFSYEMGKRPDAYRLLLKGLVVTGTIYAAYGLYQMIGMQIGLPVRGILRGTYGVDMAYEYGFVRINSLANEPKRLGYVLFLGALASVFLARLHPLSGVSLRIVSFGIFGMSLFTFSGSYFLAVFFFVCAVTLLYPTRAGVYYFGLFAAAAAAIVFFSDLGIYEALEHGFERRLEEVEIGVDGQRVYRQEFFAWEYLYRYPVAAIFGVGIGQYFINLYQEFGSGVGIGEAGVLIPLNSTFLELVFDLGLVVALLIYAGVFFLILRLRRAGEHFLCFALLFVTVQSMTILTILFMAVFAGFGLSRLVAVGKRSASFGDRRNNWTPRRTSPSQPFRDSLPR